VSGAGGTETASNNTVETEIVGNIVIGPGRHKKVEALQANGIRIRGGGRGGAYTGTANEISFLITNNKVSDFRDNGIFVGGGRGSSHVVSGSVIDNDVRDIGDVVGTGILVQSGEANNTANITLSDIIIRDNKVSNSSGDGVAVFVGFGVGNTVSLSGVTENVTNNNGVDGLVVGAGVLGSGATPISGNRADRNGQDGIDINSTGYVLSNNTASRNAVAGINADAGAVANIDGGGNVAKNNGSCNTPLPASCL
jgi:hypothetical protein